MRSRRAPLTPLGTLAAFVFAIFVVLALYGLLQVFETLRHWAAG